MDRKSKILLAIVIALMIYSVWATYDRIYVRRDYQIHAEIECNPEINSCFVWEDEETGEPWYYALIEKSAANIDDCNPHREECEELSCEEGEENCAVTFCDPGTEECE